MSSSSSTVFLLSDALARTAKSTTSWTSIRTALCPNWEEPSKVRDANVIIAMLHFVVKSGGLFGDRIVPGALKMLEQEFINGSNDPVLIKNVRQACLEFNGIHARKNNAWNSDLHAVLERVIGGSNVVFACAVLDVIDFPLRAEFVSSLLEKQQPALGVALASYLERLSAGWNSLDAGEQRDALLPLAQVVLRLLPSTSVQSRTIRYRASAVCGGSAALSEVSILLSMLRGCTVKNDGATIAFCLKGLLCICRPGFSETSFVISVLQDLALLRAFSPLPTEFVDVLCVLATRSSSVERIIMSSIAQYLQGRVATPGDVYIFHNLLTIMVTLCNASSAPSEAVKSVLPILVAAILEKPGPVAFDDVCKYLAQLALASECPAAVTSEMIFVLRSAYLINGHPKVICDCFEVLIRKLPKQTPLRVVLLKELVSLFLSIAAQHAPYTFDALSDDEAQNISAAFPASDLLVPICSCLGQITNDSQLLLEEDRPLVADGKLRRKIALVWLFCEKLRVSHHTGKLATFVPPLVNLGPNYLLSLLTGTIPTLVKDNAEAFYSRAVESLETNRAMRGDFVSFLSYLVDEELSQSPVLSSVLQAGNAALDAFLTRYLPAHSADATMVHHPQVSRHVCAILKVLSKHMHDTTTRSFCAAALEKISARWPSVLYDVDVLNLFVQIVGARDAILGDSAKAREDILRDVQAIMQLWLKRAYEMAPSKCIASAHQCVLTHAESADTLGTLMTSLDPQFTHGLEKKTRALGEVAGIQQALRALQADIQQALGGLPPVGAEDDQLRVKVLQEFEEAARASAPERPIKHAAALLHAAAVVVSCPNVSASELVQKICWSGALAAEDPSVLAEAIFCWSWIIAARNELEPQLLIGVRHAWLWTVDTKKGIFNNDDITNAATQGQRQWVVFLREQLNVSTRRAQWMTTVSQMMYHSLQGASFHSSSHSVGARFAFLHMCLHANLADSATQAVLRTRTVLVALSWFQHKPTWVKIESRDELVSTVQTLVTFCETLQLQQQQQQSKRDGGSGSVIPLTPVKSSKASAAASGGAPATPMRSPRGVRNLATQAQLWSQISVGNSAPKSKGFSLSPRGRAAQQDLESGGGAVAPSPPKSPRSRSPRPGGAGAGASSGGASSGAASSAGGSGGSASGSPVPAVLFDPSDHASRVKLLLLLIANELDRLAAWNNPQNLQVAEQRNWTTKSIALSGSLSLSQYLEVAWMVHPSIAAHMGLRIKAPEVEQKLQALVLERTVEAMHAPETVSYLITEKNVAGNVPQLGWLPYWKHPHVKDALRVLIQRYGGNPIVSSWASSVLFKLPVRELLFYLPQLVQALRWDTSGALMKFLADASKNNVLICHQVLWSTSAYTGVSDDTEFVRRVVQLQSRVKMEMSEVSRRKWAEESGFFESVTAISGVLLPMLGNDNKIRSTLETQLRQLEVKGHLYLPTNPDTRVVGIDPAGGAPMKSHAKVPILVNFLVEHELYEEAHARELQALQDGAGRTEAVLAQKPAASSSSSNTRTQACIFKVGDDVRQDMMALQIIEFCKRVFEANHLDVFLFPYKVIATHPNEGIIEVVPSSQSRDQLGKKTEGNLYQWFLTKFGAPNSPAFQKARKSFIQSMAAYSLVSYILQVKDRHNGNILVDNDGHVIHIDFGFLFDISPGGDLKFERSPFKLTQEMVDIMGGTLRTEQFALLMELSTQCFLAIREHMDEILTMVELMLGTGFNCFKAHTIASLRARFVPEKDEREACEFFTKEVILASWSTKSTVSTWVYDVFQAFQNQISY